MGLILRQPGRPQRQPRSGCPRRGISAETFKAKWRWTTRRRWRSSPAGHTFGKTHGAGPASNCGSDPEAGCLDEQGPGLEETALAPAKAVTRSPAAWKSPGPPRPRSGATTTSRTCSAFEWETHEESRRCKPVGGQRNGARSRYRAAWPTTPLQAGSRLPCSLQNLSLRFDPAYEKKSRGASCRTQDRLADAFGPGGGSS